MKPTINNLKFTCVFLILLFTIGCADDEENLPKVTANFTHTIDENSGVVTFLNTSENATKYLWDFGDGETSAEINPVKKYDDGTYIVTLMASNVAGGSGSFADTLNIKINEPVTLPINFDDDAINYNPITFSGAQFQIVDNPDPSGSNTTSSKVGELINSGAAFEGIFFNLGASIDLSSEKSIGMNFWSNSPIDVLLKLEQGNVSIENTSDHKGTGWETIYFDFDSKGQFSKLTLFADGPGNTSGTFYIDDIFQTETLCWETDLFLPINFDCEGTDYSLETFGGTAFEVISNPEVSGINNIETNVGKITNSGATFEGVAFSLDESIGFSEAEAISLKLFSSVALPLLLKLDGNTSIETLANHGGTGWENVIFEFESDTEFNQITLLIDGSGTTSGEFYIDDIMYSEGLDREAPIITLIGNANTSIIVGEDYVEEGATAIDNRDGDISDKIVIDATAVDTSIEGSYNVTYNVTDAAGNAADEVIRIVTVSATDTEKPVITLVGDNPLNINVGDTYTEPGATASDNVDGDISSSIVIDNSAVNTAAAGTYEVTYNVSDAAGNAADETTRTVIVSEATSNDNLLVNGDFENGTEAWYGEALDVRTEGDNSYSFVNVATAGAPFDVNISQLVELSPGENYTLSFDASSDRARTMIAGIGQSADPFYASTETINLTTDTQTFTLELSTIDDGTSNTFGDTNSRVLFDMGAAAGVVVIDNVSLTAGGSGSGSGSGGGEGAPTTAAPTPPARDVADVISLFSDTYDNINVDTWSAGFDDSSIEDIQVAGNNVKKITFTNFLGVEFLNDRIDATAFTGFHIDIFISSETLDKSFNLKLSDWAGGSSENSAIEFSINNGSTPAIPNPNPGTWISLDIPMSSWTSAAGGLSRADLAQLIITSNLGVVYADNIYFYK